SNVLLAARASRLTSCPSPAWSGARRARSCFLPGPPCRNNLLGPNRPITRQEMGVPIEPRMLPAQGHWWASAGRREEREHPCWASASLRPWDGLLTENHFGSVAGGGRGLPVGPRTGLQVPSGIGLQVPTLRSTVAEVSM